MMRRKLYYLLKHHRNQWLPADRLSDLQDRLLRRLVDHAYRTVPYYRTLFQSVNLRPEDIRGVQDIGNIPITTKQMLLKVPLIERTSTSYRLADLSCHPTGGSTGIITDVCFTESYDDLRAAFQFRTYFANNYRFTDTIANLQYLPVSTNPLTRFGLLKRVGIPFDMPLDEQISLLASLRPQVLEGYPSRLAQIARNLADKGSSPVIPKLVLTNSETLTPTLRRQIKNAFSITPTDVYEMWEFGTIAWECACHDGLHINADHSIIEILKNGVVAPPGESGEIVGTNLFNDAMPFIRYATGDCGTGTDKRCACGRTLPLMREILGRATEKIVLSDGTAFIATTQLDAAMYETTGVREYQCVQREKGTLDVMVVADGRFTPQEKERIEQRLAHLFKLGRVRLERVESIPKTPVGKRKTFVSEILN
jgi:phenylacetate-CoA ligase